MHMSDLAVKLANNHAKFESFGWSSDAQPEDKHLWTIVYTSNRDSDVLEQSNAACIARELDRYEGTTVETISHSHWAVGHVDGFLIRVYEADGTTITPAFTAYAECMIALKNDPVLDESDYSEREQAAADETWKHCYRTSQRIEYIRDNREEFEFRSFADMLGCVRGNYFAGYASELLA